MIKLKDLLFEQDTNDIAGILLFVKNKVLVLYKTSGDVDIPKGHISEGESPLEAVKRELNEEAGIVLNVEPIQVGRLNVEPGKDLYMFTLQTNQRFVVKTSNEHRGHKFVPIEEIDDNFFWSPVQQFYNNIMEKQNENS